MMFVEVMNASSQKRRGREAVVRTCKSMLNAIMFKKMFKAKKFFGVICLNRAKFIICLVFIKDF